MKKIRKKMSETKNNLFQARKDYLNLKITAKVRLAELSKLLGPYVNVTDQYGILICEITHILGITAPQNVKDRAIRDLMSDIFDSLYESRHLLLENKLHLAYPLLRRAYESLSLTDLMCIDATYADKWEAGKEIKNEEVRTQLANHPLGEKIDDTKNMYKFFSNSSHPNRGFIPYRFLGEGNEFVLGSIGQPDLLMISDYALKHLNMWFWFGALITFEYKELLSNIYIEHYRDTAKSAQNTASWLGENINKLVEKRDADKVDV